MIASNRIPQGAMARFRARFFDADNLPGSPPAATIYLKSDVDPSVKAELAMQPIGDGYYAVNWPTAGVPIGDVSGHLRTTGPFPVAKNFTLTITGNPATPA